MKKNLIKSVGMTIFISIVMLFLSSFLFNASVILAESRQGGTGSFTDKDEFYCKGVESNIVNYTDSMINTITGKPNLILADSYGDGVNYMRTVKYAEEPISKIMKLHAIDDDAITQIVPKNLFKEKNDGIVHIGREYGFFIKTEELANGQLLSNVFLFDISNRINDHDLKDNVRFKITALFQREYIYLPSNTNSIQTRVVFPGEEYTVKSEFDQVISLNLEKPDIVIPLPYFISVNNYAFVNSNRYYMTDIVNTVSIYNEQHLNEGDAGYNMYEDKGRYITNQDVEYDATIYDFNENKSEDALDVALKIGFNESKNSFIGVIPGLSSTLTLLNLLTETAMATLDKEYFTNKIFSYTPNYVTAQGQIAETNKLSRTAISKIEISNEDGNYDSTRLLHYNYGEGFGSDYQLGYTPVLNENGNCFVTPWETRIKRGYTLKFRNSNDSCDVVSGGDIHDFQKNDAGEREYRDLENTQSVSLLTNGENLFSFTPLYSGSYTLATNHADSEISLQALNDPNVEILSESLTGYDRKLTLKMQAATTYYFRTNYVDKTKYGGYELQCEPKTVELGSNAINMFSSQNLVKFISNENINYRFKVNDTSCMLSIFDENLNLIQQVFNEDLVYTLLKDKTYYLKIEKSDFTTTQELTLNIKDEMYVLLKKIDGLAYEISNSITVSSLDAVEIPIPEKVGYTFDGWWTSFESFGEQVTFENILEFKLPTLTLYAKWTPINYTIFYEECGGKEIPNGEYFIEHAVLLASSISKAEQVFCGWFDNLTYDGEKIEMLPVGSFGDKTFYAKWVKDTFIVNLNVNASYTDGVHAALSESNKRVNFKENFTLPVPNLAGFIFNGWHEDEKQFTYSNGQSLNIYTEENDITLTAKWIREKFYIKVSNDGQYKWLTKEGNSFNFSQNQTAIENEIGLCPNCYIESELTKGGTGAYSIREHLFKEGYRYKYMIKNKDDITSLACWQGAALGESYGNGDVIEIFTYHEKETQFKIFVEGYDTIYADFGESLSFSIPDKEGYTFEYFKVSNNTLNNIYIDTHLAPGQIFNYDTMPDFSVGIEQDGAAIYLTPVFIPNKYIVSFTNVVNSLENKEVIFGSSYNTSNGNAFPTPIKIGYRFKGWYVEVGEDYEKKTDEFGNVNYWDISRNVTLTAKWDACQYVVLLDPQGGAISLDRVIVAYGATMPVLAEAVAPTRVGHEFKGYYTGVNGAGVQYYNKNMLSTNVWNIDSAEEIVLYAFWEKILFTLTFNSGFGAKTGYYADEVRLPEIYKKGYIRRWVSEGVSYTGASVYTISKNQYFELSQTAETYSVIFSQESEDNEIIETGPGSFTATYDKAYTKTAPEVTGYSFVRWEHKITSPRTQHYYNQNFSNSSTITIKNACDANDQCYTSMNIRFIAIYKKSCVAAGSLITLADGSQKPVETLTGLEELLVWNLKIGQFDTAPIVFVDSDELISYEVVNLQFSDNTVVKVISEHAFWDIDLNKYVFLRNDAAKYIGHWFNKQVINDNGNLGWISVQLTNVIVAKEITTSWSPVTAEHLCYYVNGMLTMPGGTSGIINIFEVDALTMQYNQELMLADIETYGLFSYEEFVSIMFIPEVIFEAFDVQYFKIAIGKQILDWDSLRCLIELYSEFFE